MKPFRACLIAAIFALAGCGSNNFPSYTQLGDLRVLAIQASSPEVAPGSSSNLTVLLSDINGGGRTITETVTACTDPGIGYGAVPTCVGASDLLSLTPTSNTFTLSSPAYTQALTSLSVTVPSTILSQRSTVDQFNGVSYIVEFTFTASNGASSVTAFKRIVASTKNTYNYAFNSNPSITDILTASSASVTTLSAANGTLYPNILSSSQEIFPVMASDGSISSYQETLTTTWFASDGGFNVQRTQNTDGNGYGAPTALPSGHSVVLVAVTRDGRDGESYVIKSF